MIQNKEKTNESSLRRTRIEREVIARRSVRAQARISAYLTVNRYSDEAVLEACEWYRRLGLYRAGLKLLKLESGFVGQPAHASFAAKRMLWAARFLNALGASEFALGLIEKVKPGDAEDWRILGGIYLSNYYFSESKDAYETMRKLEAKPESYRSRLALVSYADALSEVGDENFALACVLEVLKKSPEPLLQGICLQAAGEYLIAAKKYKAALTYLNRAEAFFPKMDRTSDRGFLLKWLGYSHGKLGSRELALRYFEQAEKLLFRPEVRPEVGLELLRLKQELGFLTTKEQQRLYFYPGLAIGLKRKLPKISQAFFGAKSARLQINFRANEFTLDQKCALGIPKEVALLGYIALAGKRGLSRVRAKTLLWPGEVFSYLSMNARLNQLVARIRTRYEIEVACRDEILMLDKKAASDVSVITGDPSLPSFLDSADAFTATEFSHYYGLKKTQAAQELNRWIECNYVEPLKTGKNRRYRPLTGALAAS